MQGELAWIEIPIADSTGRSVVLPSGTPYKFWYIGPDGSHYHFYTTILGKGKDQIPTLMIKVPPKDKIIRTQRRNFVRVELQIEIAVMLNEKVRAYHFLAKTIDLSGGGLSFSCPVHYRLNEGDELNIWLCLPNKSTATIAHARVVGEVVRCKPPEEEGYPQWVSVKFTKVSEADRAQIVRSCYQRQLELRNKGILE